MKKNIFVILLFSLTLSACKHPIQDKLDAYYDIFDKNLPNMIKFLDEYPIEKQQLFSCEVNTETHTYGKHRIISDNEA